MQSRAGFVVLIVGAMAIVIGILLMTKSVADVEVTCGDEPTSRSHQCVEAGSDGKRGYEAQRKHLIDARNSYYHGSGTEGVVAGFGLCAFGCFRAFRPVTENHQSWTHRESVGPRV